ncbi:MAG: hypothetical protein H7Y88_09015 [Phycisphaerales bacterium]|nr:hypothetical protein [Phycisphaerales bacterium]
MLRPLALVAGALLASSALAQPALISSTPMGVGNIVSIAMDPITDRVFVYDNFATVIRIYDRSLSSLGTIPFPIPISNDVDLDIATHPLNVDGVIVPPGTLLILDGESGDGDLLAIDPSTGAVLAQTNCPITGTPVGGAHHPTHATAYLASYTNDRVYEVSPITGAPLRNFPVRPVGSPAFDLFYGDMEVLAATGNLHIVGSPQDSIRELTSDGVFVQDLSLVALGVVDMSGIAFDDTRGEAWISNTGGVVYHLSGFAATGIDCDADGTLDATEIAQTPGLDCFTRVALAVGGFSVRVGPDGILDSCQCVADWNRDFAVGSADITAFLSSWFNDLATGQSGADANCSGGTGSNDITAFLGLWFASVGNQAPLDGCP